MQFIKESKKRLGSVIDQITKSVMHERQLLKATSGSPCTTPRSFGVKLRSSLEDIHVVTLPTLTARQTDGYEIDLLRRFDDITDVRDINQLQCRLVESRLCVLDRTERVLKSHVEKIDYEKMDDIAFLLDETTVEKLDLEECLGTINAMRREVEDRVKALEDERKQLKAKHFMCKRGLQEREDEGTQCLMKLLMKLEQVSQPATKIPMPIVENTKANCGDFVASKPKDQKSIHGDIKRTEPNIKGKHSSIPTQNTNSRFKNIKSKLNTGRPNVAHTKENAILDRRTVRQNVEHTKDNVHLDRRTVRQNVGHAKENTLLDRRTVRQSMENRKENVHLDRRTVSQNVEHRKENVHLDRRTVSQNVELTNGKTQLDRRTVRQNVKRVEANSQLHRRTVRHNVETTVANARIDTRACLQKAGYIRVKTAIKKWWKRVPHASLKVDVADKVKGGKKKIKSKLDTGRNNSERRDLTNPSDIKTRSEAKSSFVNKQPLPQIRNIANKKAVTKDQQNRNGNNNMRAPLPKLKCRGRHGNGAVSSPSSTEVPLSPVSFGSTRSTPLPPIKSAHKDALDTESKSDTYTEVGRRTYVSWISGSLSPTRDTIERME